jgi:hypothetical protein
MTTENVKPIEIIKKESEASSFKPVKKEKNPNRVAGALNMFCSCQCCSKRSKIHSKSII